MGSIIYISSNPTFLSFQDISIGKLIKDKLDFFKTRSWRQKGLKQACIKKKTRRRLLVIFSYRYRRVC